MRPFAAIAVTALLILSARPGSAQQGSTETVNPAPLERPHPLTVVEDADPSALISKASDKLKSKGFDPVTVHRKEFFVDARKYSDKDYDRVIVWLARDVANPSRYINVYFLFGRYEEMIARKGKAVYRIEIDSEREEEIIGALKQELIDVLTTGVEHK